MTLMNAPTISTNQTKHTITTIMTKKREKYSEVKPAQNYMAGLSLLVGKACDKWLDERGMKNKSWKQTREENAEKRKKREQGGD